MKSRIQKLAPVAVFLFGTLWVHFAAATKFHHDQPTLPPDQCDITQSGLEQNLCNPGLNLYYAVSNAAPPDTILHDAVRVDPGAPSAPIDINNYQGCDECYYITNISASNSIFVPFKTCDEFNAFLAAAQTGAPSSYIRLNTCAREWTPPVSDFPPDTTQGDLYYCNSPVLTQGPSPELPYAPTGTIVPSAAPYNVPETAQYQCTCTGSGQNWTETVTQTYTAGNLTWSAGTPTYSGAVPATCNISGCGSASNGNWQTCSLETFSPNLCASGFSLSDFLTIPNDLGALEWHWKCTALDGTVSMCFANSWYCVNHEPPWGGVPVCQNSPVAPNASYCEGPQLCVYRLQNGACP